MRRLARIAAGGRILDLPTFFPAISSVKTNLGPHEYLSALIAARAPSFLISAYDLHRAPAHRRTDMMGKLASASHSGCTILLDSGNYEAHWMNDRSWTRTGFNRILAKTPCAFALSFDCPPLKHSRARIISDIVRRVTTEQALTSRATVLPIVHSSHRDLRTVVVEVARRLRPLVLALPERALGNGVSARAETVKHIRRALNTLDFYCPIHLLGTGNPLSILIYSICGADSFDGLEWCQTSIEHSSGRPFHFQHWDFFSTQSPLANRLVGLNWNRRVLVDNLYFLSRWMRQIQESLRAGAGPKLLREHIPRSISEAVLRGTAQFAEYAS